jgi:hypothetical protein
VTQENLRRPAALAGFADLSPETSRWYFDFRNQSDEFRMQKRCSR